MFENDGEECRAEGWEGWEGLAELRNVGSRWLLT